MANVLFTYELQRKLRKIGSKIQAYCVHPGVVDTELQRNLPIDWYVNLREAGRLINPPEGARGQIFVATSEALENDEGGKYSSELSNEGKPRTRLSFVQRQVQLGPRKLGQVVEGK